MKDQRSHLLTDQYPTDIDDDALWADVEELFRALKELQIEEISLRTREEAIRSLSHINSLQAKLREKLDQSRALLNMLEKRRAALLASVDMRTDPPLQ